MNYKQLFLILLLLITNKTWSQQAIQVTDTQPVVINGLNIGYNIKSQEVKKVGDKGDFSRYAIRFYVTNIDNFPKVIRYREGFPNGDGVSDRLVQFNILNATGARLTSNVAYISAAPYNIEVRDDREHHDPDKERRMKQIGFWIQAGQTLSVDEIVIVPLNEQPNVQVIFTGNMLHPLEYGPENRPYIVQSNPGYQMPPPPVAGPIVDFQGPVRIKNKFTNTYINNQNAPVTASPIDYGWWSAQWELVLVSGSNFYNIQNRWKHNFLDEDRHFATVSQSNQPPTTVWVIERGREPNTFRIKNSRSGGYLCIENNQLVVSDRFHDEYSSFWWFERP